MGLILECPHCSDCFMAEGNCVGNEAVCPFCGGNFQANEATTASESPQAEQDFATKHETPGLVPKLLATCSSIAVTAGAAAQLFWLNIRLLFARGVNRSKALVRLGEQCYEERRLVAEEIELYERLDSYSQRATDLELALDADAGAASGWWDKVKKIGGRWGKRAELAKTFALKMKLHRDLGERFFQSQGGAQTEDPVVAQVAAEQQRIRELESRAEKLQLRVPKILAHPAVAGAVMVALLAVAALAMPKELTTAILPVSAPFRASSSVSDSSNSAKAESPELLASPAGLRRGPKIHGFQLGMTFDEYVANLERLLSPGQVKVESVGTRPRLGGSGDPFYDALEGDIEEFMLFRIDPTTGDGPYIASASTIGDAAIVAEFHLEPGLVNKLFKAPNDGFNDFCQEFINGYEIPKLTGADGRMFYRSPDGWLIELWDINGIKLSVTPLKPRVDHGFGQ